MEICDPQGPSREEGPNRLQQLYRGIPLAALAGKVLLIIVASRLDKLLRDRGISPGGTVWLPPRTMKTIDTLFVVRRLQEVIRQRKTPLYRALNRSARKRTTLSTESCCGRYSSHTLRRAKQDAYNYPPFPRRHAGWRAYERRRALGMVCCHAGASARLRAITVTFQRVFSCCSTRRTININSMLHPRQSHRQGFGST